MKSQRSLTKKCLAKVAAGVLTLAAATQAPANSIIALTNNNSFGFGAGTVFVPIAAGVFQTAPFFNGFNQRFIVSYTAECGVNAANTTSFVDLTIRVVNIATGVITVLSPTAGGTDAFCSANGTPGFDGLQMHTVHAVGGVGLPAGNYRVQVLARVNGPGAGNLDDSALIVWR